MDPKNLPSRYEYLNEKDSGGQAEVLFCNDRYLDRKVAIKFYPGGEDIEEFTKEILSLKRVTSPHITQLYDLIPDPEGGLPGIVQEYIPGDSLAKFADTDPGLREFLQVVYQVACGLRDLHEHQIVHRDIKPHNMRFDDEGVAKILDFGLSCSLVEDVETLYSRGTYGFKAPELFDDPPVPITQAVDVYAFGATAWFLAEADLPDALMDIPPLSQGNLPSFGEISIKLPDDIRGALDACLLKDPEQRPTMQEIALLLERQLLHGKHRAELLHNGKRHVVSWSTQRARIEAKGFGRIVIRYDGVSFYVDECTKDVFINNVPARAGMELPSSCVITLGPQASGPDRVFVSFNVSHPEVVL